MSPALNRSSAIWRFEYSNAIKICSGIIFDFYMGLSHVCQYLTCLADQCVRMSPVLNGSSVDGSSLDGSSLDRSSLDGSSLDRSLMNESSVSGSLLNGSLGQHYSASSKAV